jgi:hypothetical protein
MAKRLSLVALMMAALLLVAAPALATAGKGSLYLDGQVVRTVVPPAAIPHGGTDPIYMVTNGAGGQLGIAAVGPGYDGYHGGRWAVYLVTFTVAPYLLTSDEAVFAAEAAGDVTVVRAPELDNRCPVLP